MVRLRTKVETKKINKAEEKIEKKYDCDIFSANDSDNTDFQLTPTGLDNLDKAWGGGMIAGINQIWGVEEVGKSTLVATILGNVARNFNMRGLYVDFERKMTASYLQKCGVDNPEYHKIAKPNKDIDGIRYIAECVDSGLYDIVIIDSIGSISAKNDVDAENIGSRDVGDRTALIDPLVNWVTRKCEKNNIIVLCVNQARKNIVTNKWAAKYAPELKWTGGHSYNYQLFNSVFLSPKGFIKNSEGEKVGKKIRATVDKNKMGANYTTFDFDMMCGGDFDMSISFINMAVNAGVIDAESSKGWMILHNGKKLRRKDLEDLLESDEGAKLKAEIEAKMSEVLDG